MGKRQGESIYNINNIVIHTLVAKIEKLQYKDIITPRYGAAPRGVSDSIHTRTHTPDMANKPKLITKISLQLASERPLTSGSQADGG